MKRIAFVLLFSCIVNFISAQTTDRLSYSANLDLFSSHLWRGFKNGNSLSIQPTISLEYKGLTFGSWAAYAGNGSYFELDLFVEYSYRSFVFSMYDYFCPTSINDAHFFDFRKSYTKHTLDAMVTWRPERLPIKILASTLVLGDDISKQRVNSAFLLIFEPAIVWNWKSFSGDIFGGLTPFNGYYAAQPSFVNIGSTLGYKVRVGGELPLQAKISYNPEYNSFWYTFGVSLSVKK